MALGHYVCILWMTKYRSSGVELGGLEGPLAVMMSSLHGFERQGWFAFLVNESEMNFANRIPD